jgi:hypothetical protein
MHTRLRLHHVMLANRDFNTRYKGLMLDGQGHVSLQSGFLVWIPYKLFERKPEFLEYLYF